MYLPMSDTNTPHRSSTNCFAVVHICFPPTSQSNEFILILKKLSSEFYAVERPKLQQSPAIANSATTTHAIAPQIKKSSSLKTVAMVNKTCPSTYPAEPLPVPLPAPFPVLLFAVYDSPRAPEILADTLLQMQLRHVFNQAA